MRQVNNGFPVKLEYGVMHATILRLTGRAKICRALTLTNGADGSLAHSARLPFAVIHECIDLKVTEFAIGLDVVAER